MNWKKTLLICLLILFGGGALTTLIFFTEPEASRSGATKQTAMLVDVATAEQGTYTPTIKAMGTVEAARNVELSPRVEGQIVELSDSFVPGGFVQSGEALLKIDPADYQIALNQRRSELRQAKADLNIELGRQTIAQRDYELVEDSLSPENRALVLREPQLDAVRSRVDLAQAAVDQAQLNLSRTTITAPFDAHILSRNVNLGSQVSTNTVAGRLVGLDRYWVVATIPAGKLRWLTFPQNKNETGSTVRITNKTAWDDGEERLGTLYRQIGALENNTRMARVIIEVTDPMAYDDENRGKPKLMIGAYVETHILAEKLTDVIRLERDLVRKDNTVWVMQDGKLSIKPVQIKFQDAQYAYITEGLEPGSQIVTTNLSTVTEGAPLRLVDSSANTNSE